MLRSRIEIWCLKCRLRLTTLWPRWAILAFQGFIRLMMMSLLLALLEVAGYAATLLAARAPSSAWMLIAGSACAPNVQELLCRSLILRLRWIPLGLWNIIVGAVEAAAEDMLMLAEQRSLGIHLRASFMLMRNTGR